MGANKAVKKLRCILGRHSIRDENITIKSKDLRRNKWESIKAIRITGRCEYCEWEKSYIKIISITIEPGRSRSELKANVNIY